MSAKERLKKFYSGLISGSVASFVTQPLEVIKTIILVNPSKDPIIEKGYTLNSVKNSCVFIYNHEKKGIRNFFRGGMVSCMRQSTGFALYTFFIDSFDKWLKNLKHIYIKYGLSALGAKIIATTLTSPLILIKTRLELITQNEYTSLIDTFRIIKKESIFSLFRGITSVLSRELVFSMFHYSFYRYLIDNNKKDSNFHLLFLAYSAGLLAMFVSHPFEVVRNRIMIPDKYLIESKKYNGLYNGLKKIIMTEGMVGFFKGILPRLARKPVNSAIVWSVFEIRNKNSKKSA